MTSLADALTTAQARKPGPKCTVAVVLAELPPKDRDALANAINETRRGIKLSSEHLALECTSAGVPIGPHPIARHRRKGCACYTTGTL